MERLARAGHIKRSLANLPPPGRGRLALDSAIARGMGLLHRLEQRFTVLRHPRVMKLRNRLGVMLSGGGTSATP